MRTLYTASLTIKIHGYVSQHHLLFIGLTVPKQITHKVRQIFKDLVSNRISDYISDLKWTAVQRDQRTSLLEHRGWGKNSTFWTEKYHTESVFAHEPLSVSLLFPQFNVWWWRMQSQFYTAAKQGASPLSLNTKYLLVVTDIATRHSGNNISTRCSKNKVSCGIFGKVLDFRATYSKCPLILLVGFHHIWSE